jgi:hypothetical protein
MLATTMVEVAARGGGWVGRGNTWQIVVRRERGGCGPRVRHGPWLWAETRMNFPVLTARSCGSHSGRRVYLYKMTPPSSGPPLSLPLSLFLACTLTTSAVPLLMFFRWRGKTLLHPLRSDGNPKP